MKKLTLLIFILFCSTLFAQTQWTLVCSVTPGQTVCSQNGTTTPYFRGFNRLIRNPLNGRPVAFWADHDGDIYSNAMIEWDTANRQWGSFIFTNGNANTCIGNETNGGFIGHPSEHPYAQQMLDPITNKLVQVSGVCNSIALRSIRTFDFNSHSWAVDHNYDGYYKATNVTGQKGIYGATNPGATAIAATGQLEAAFGVWVSADNTTKTYVFAGGANPSNTVWYMDGNNQSDSWHAATSLPATLDAPGLVWDSCNKKLVLLGGTASGSTVSAKLAAASFSNVYVWNDSLKRFDTQATSGSIPAGRWFPAVSFDSNRCRFLVLVPDDGQTNTVNGDSSLNKVYALDANSYVWSDLNISGGPATNTSCYFQCITMSYDPVVDAMVSTGYDANNRSRPLVYQYNFNNFSTPVSIMEELPAGVTGIDRTDSNVTFGIPIPRGTVTNINTLGFSGTGCTGGQFKTESTWDDGSIKWVLVDGQVSLTANQIKTGCTFNASGSGNTGSNMATDTGTAIQVNTGAAIFLLKKQNHNGFDQVSVGVTNMVAAGTSSGLVLYGPSAGVDNCNGGACTVLYGMKYDSNSDCVIDEQSGSIRTVVKCTGRMMDSTSTNEYMRATIRYEFYKNKSRARISVALRNDYNNSSTWNKAFKGFKNLEFRVTPIQTISAAKFGNHTATPTDLPSFNTDTYLYQMYSNKYEDSELSTMKQFITKVGSTYVQEGYQIISNGAIVASGDKTQYSEGWGDFTTPFGIGLLVGHYQPASYWPKSIEYRAASNEIRLGIWPDQDICMTTTTCAAGSGIPYYLPWPQISVNDVYVNFHTTALSNPSQEYLKQQYKLVAHAPYSYYNTANIWPFPMLSATEEDAYDTSLNLATVPIAEDSSYFHPNRTIRNFYFGQGSATNQTDFRFNAYMSFIKRDYKAHFMWGEHFTHHLIENMWGYSDGFDWRTTAGSKTSYCMPADSSNNSSLATRNWMNDNNHMHFEGVPEEYFLTGNLFVKDLLEGPWKDRFLNTSCLNNQYVGTTRAVGNVIKTMASFYRYLRDTGQSSDATTVAGVIDTVLNNQVWPDFKLGGYGSSAGGVNRKRGIQGGSATDSLASCYGTSNLANCVGPTDGDQNGCFTTKTPHCYPRIAQPLEQDLLIDGLYQLMWTRGTTWNKYEDAFDIAYGAAMWSQTEGYRDDGVANCNSPSITSGMIFNASIDWPNKGYTCQVGDVSCDNAAPDQSDCEYRATIAQTVWANWFILQKRGNWTYYDRFVVNAKRNDGTGFRERNAVNFETVAYQKTKQSVLPKGLIRLTPSVSTFTGGTSTTVSWTTPANTQEIIFKYLDRATTFTDGPVGYDVLNPCATLDPALKGVTNNDCWTQDPATHDPWYFGTNCNSFNTSCGAEPTPVVGTQSQTLTGLDPAKTYSFVVYAVINDNPPIPSSPGKRGNRQFKNRVIH